MKLLLDICHWIILGYAGVLVARIILDGVLLAGPRLKERLLPLENVILAITDPVLDPLRILFRSWTPEWLDPSPPVAVILCCIVDYLVVYVSGRL